MSVRKIPCYAALVIVFFIAGLLLLTGCTNTTVQPEENGGSAGNGFPLTVEDSLGRSVDIEQEPQRIISLAPGNTEILYALGAQDKLVGVTSYCDYPEEALEKEKVGGFSDPNIEKIISLNPDLVLATTMHEEIVTELEGINIPVVVLHASTVDGVLQIIELAGKVTGRTGEAAAITGSMREKIELVESKTKDIPQESRPKVYYEVFSEPIMTAGPGTLIHDLITRAGGINIGADAETAYPQYSMEVLVKKDPEVIIAAKYSMGAQEDSQGMTEEETSGSDAQVIESIKQRAGWASISAVKNNRVYIIEDDLITAPGPRITSGLEAMARALYPDKFVD